MITDVSDRPGRTQNRDLYLDALRTAAIVRVVTYHTFGGSWLSWIFPAMGVMFALAGGLMVRSLDKQPPLTVIRNRARRLLPALWLFALVIIPVMIWGGGAVSNWTDPNTGLPVPHWKLIFWAVPILDPPGNEFGANFTVVLWYLRTYLWLVALSPLLLKAFRRWPVPTLVAPLAIVVAQAFGVLPGPDEGPVWDLVSTLGMFAPCWMLGFAHRTGKLAKVPLPALLGIVAATAAGGVAWALSHPVEDDPSVRFDLNGIPLANALWSIAFIIVLLRFAPNAGWIGRTPFLGRLVALVNNRAVTIYLWHNVMIDASFPVDDWLTRWLPEGLVESRPWDFVTIWVLIAACVLAFGWVEDLAARRKPRLFPVGPSAAQRRSEYAAEQAALPDPDAAAPVPTQEPVPATAAAPGPYRQDPGHHGQERYRQAPYRPAPNGPDGRRYDGPAQPSYGPPPQGGYRQDGYGPNRGEQAHRGRPAPQRTPRPAPARHSDTERRPATAPHPDAAPRRASRPTGRYGEDPAPGYPTQLPAPEGQPTRPPRARH